MSDVFSSFNTVRSLARLTRLNTVLARLQNTASTERVVSKQTVLKYRLSPRILEVVLSTPFCTSSYLNFGSAFFHSIFHGTTASQK